MKRSRINAILATVCLFSAALCHAGEKSRLAGTPFILVAAAGGSGNGAVSCLASMERLTQHVGARRFDMVSVNRWNREYKIKAIRDSTAAMAGELVRK